MMNVAICDDDISFTGKFEQMLITIKNMEHIELEPEVYLDGKELIEDIYERGKKYDLILIWVSKLAVTYSVYPRDNV